MSFNESKKVNNNDKENNNTHNVDNESTDKSKYNYDKSSEDITKKSFETQKKVDKKIDARSSKHENFSDRARMAIELDSPKSILNKAAFILSLISCVLNLFSYHKNTDELIVTHDHTCYMYFFISAIISGILSILSLRGTIANIYMLNFLVLGRFIIFLGKILVYKVVGYTPYSLVTENISPIK